MSEHRYFTVEPTALTIRERGALAIYCGDAPRETETGTSLSLRAPLLVMPPEMFTDADETMAKVASVLNAHAGEFYPSANAATRSDTDRIANPLITRLIEAVAVAERPGATQKQRKAAFSAEGELRKFVNELAADASRAAGLEVRLSRIGREACGTGCPGESLRVIRGLAAEGGAA